MSRNKGKIVEMYRVPQCGISVEIRLTTDLQFSAVVGGETLQDKDAAALKSAIRQKAWAAAAAEWKPVISIAYAAHLNREQAAEFELKFDRFYVCEIGDSVRELSWAAYEHFKHEDASIVLQRSKRCSHELKDRTAIGSIDYHTEVNGDMCGQDVKCRSGTFFRPYSDALWEGLCRLREMILLVNARIGDLIGTDQGLARLMSGSMGLLLDHKPDEGIVEE